MLLANYLFIYHLSVLTVLSCDISMTCNQPLAAIMKVQKVNTKITKRIANISA